MNEVKDAGALIPAENDAFEKAHRIERQIDEARALAEELELTNRELSQALIEAEAARVRAEESEALIRGSEARERFLAEVSSVLASSLNYEITVQRIAELAVPALGDWCAIDLLDSHNLLQQLAIAHIDPTKIEWAKDFRRRYPPVADATTGAVNVARTGKSEFYPDVTSEMLENASLDAEHLRAIRELDIQGVIIAPVTVSGRTLGALTLVSSARAGRYTAADVSLAEEVARRAALAIDNARLYTAERKARFAAEEMASRAGRLHEMERAARESAQAANSAKSDFLATMSHELRTPINAIQGYAQLIDLGIAGPVTEQQGDYLARLGASAAHLLGLVNEVLDLAKIESGTIRVNIGSTVASGTVDAVLSLVKPQAHAKGIAISEQCEGTRDTPYIGDEHRVRQIITNLLSNAVKFTPPGGRINVGCALTNEPPPELGLKQGSPYVVCRVRDTGCGIASDQAERIFDPFTQAETGRRNTYTRGIGGTGLGLTTSRRLARLMGGELTVDSSIGAGSEFKLILPAPERRLQPRDGKVPTGIASESAQMDRAGLTVGMTPRFQNRASLLQIGNGLIAIAGSVTDDWVERLRNASEFPDDRTPSVSQLQDHAATFITEMGVSLRFLGGGDAEIADFMRDGSAIMRTLAEQHGVQRCRIGWSESMVEHEMALLRDTMSDAIKRLASPDAPAEIADALAAINQFVTQATKYSIAAFRYAVSMSSYDNSDQAATTSIDANDGEVIQPS